jgi:hypothetical protein
MTRVEKLSCAEVRAERDRLRSKIAKHEKTIRELSGRCLHDEERDEYDYQDPKPYTRCLGCGRVR